MRTTGTREVTRGRNPLDASVAAIVSAGLLAAGFLLSPIGYDLMFRLGAQTGAAIFAWVDGDHTEGVPSR